MPAIIEISKKRIINEAVALIKKEGYENFNARNLAKNLGVSTKPLYRVYGSMDEIICDVDKQIYNIYDIFINENLDQQNPLLSICISYVDFSIKYKNLFKCLFLSNNLNWNNIDQVLDEKWNQATIVNLVNKQGMTFTDAKELFVNLWLYANGLATLLASNEIQMLEGEIKDKIIFMYRRLSANINIKEVVRY